MVAVIVFGSIPTPLIAAESVTFPIWSGCFKNRPISKLSNANTPSYCWFLVAVMFFKFPANDAPPKSDFRVVFSVRSSIFPFILPTNDTRCGSSMLAGIDPFGASFNKSFLVTISSLTVKFKVVFWTLGKPTICPCSLRVAWSKPRTEKSETVKLLTVPAAVPFSFKISFSFPLKGGVSAKFGANNKISLKANWLLLRRVLSRALPMFFVSSSSEA